MRKIFLSLAVFATAIVGSAGLEAGYGVSPHRTTYRALATESTLVVRASISEVVLTDVSEQGVNRDAIMERINAPEDTNMRRDVVLNISKIVTKRANVNVTVGNLRVVSTRQQKLEQYPESLQNGEEALFFLQQRDNGDWEFRGEQRGLFSSEDAAGDLYAAESVVERIAADRRGIIGDGDFFAAAQNTMMKEIYRSDSRLAIDALIDFGWNFNAFAGHFDEVEKGELLSIVEDTTAASAHRREAITAIGRMLPEGGQDVLVSMIASDTHASTTSLAAWALEQYGRGSSSTKLVDLYLTLSDDDQRAAVIRGLGLIRPKAYRTSEVSANQRFTQVLRSALASTESDEVKTEALIAARDMRFNNNQVNAELKAIVLNFRSGASENEIEYKRAIVALASTRTEESRAFLNEQLGHFNGNYDKHIELAIDMPFNTLVDYR